MPVVASTTWAIKPYGKMILWKLDPGLLYIGVEESEISKVPLYGLLSVLLSAMTTCKLVVRCHLIEIGRIIYMYIMWYIYHCPVPPSIPEMTPLWEFAKQIRASFSKPKNLSGYGELLI